MNTDRFFTGTRLLTPPAVVIRPPVLPWPVSAARRGCPALARLRLACVPALLFFLAGCAPDLTALKHDMATESEIFVVYVQGSVVTKIFQTLASRSRTPEAYRAIAETVRKGLARHLSGHRVRASAAARQRGKDAVGLEVTVIVRAGYSCEGEAPTYGCGLTVQSRITFRSLRTGKVVGPWENIIGEVWYGRHPMVMEDPPGIEPARGARVAALNEAIHREVPATLLLGPLESATEEGLAAFLENLKATGG